MENTEFTPPQFPTTSGVRTTFLTVICILTFIGSGWGLIQAARGYMTAEQTAQEASEALSKAEDQMTEDSPSFLKSIMSSSGAAANADNIRKSSIFSLISNLLTLGGAIMMWMLKKTGFYLYIAGIVVLVATPLIVFGAGAIGAIAAVSSAVVGGIFIIMYGVNTKHMS